MKNDVENLLNTVDATLDFSNAEALARGLESLLNVDVQAATTLLYMLQDELKKLSRSADLIHVEMLALNEKIIL